MRKSVITVLISLLSLLSVGTDLWAKTAIECFGGQTCWQDDLHDGLKPGFYNPNSCAFRMTEKAGYEPFIYYMHMGKVNAYDLNFQKEDCDLSVACRDMYHLLPEAEREAKCCKNFGEAECDKYKFHV